MIIDHPTLRTRADDPCQVAQCDFCRRICKRAGKDIGEAVEVARKSGFVLVPGEKLADPKKWSCGCHERSPK
jgi:hypothetical protein